MTTYLFKKITIILSIILALTAQGCSIAQPSKNKKENISIRLTTNENVNPDINNRPSPLSLYIYLVDDPDYFFTQNYFELTGLAENRTISSIELIDNFVIYPKSQKTKEYKLSKDDKFIGIVAGFRDINNSHWKINVDKSEIKKNFFSRIFTKKKTIDIQVNDKKIMYKEK